MQIDETYDENVTEEKRGRMLGRWGRDGRESRVRQEKF